MGDEVTISKDNTRVLTKALKLGPNRPGLLAKTRATVDTESLACSQGLGAWPNSCAALEGHPAVLSLLPS